MVTRAHRKATTPWEKIVHQTDEMGKVPLPIVDTATLDPDRAPAISLLAPGVIDDSPIIFVDVNGMSAADQVTLHSLLHVLQGMIQLSNATAAVRKDVLIGAEPAEFWGIYHAGGLNYEFYGPRSTVIQLSDLDRGLQQAIWGLLRSIALLGAQYPNREASVVRSCPLQK